MYAFDKLLGPNIFKIEKSLRKITVNIAVLICIKPGL